MKLLDYKTQHIALNKSGLSAILSNDKIISGWL